MPLNCYICWKVCDCKRKCDIWRVGKIVNWFTERSVKGRKSNLVHRGAVQC